MASRVPQLPYVYWLIDQDSHAQYENRRRLTHYSILTDGTQKVGYEVKNPITGYNYAYRLRVKNEIAVKAREQLEFSFQVGLGLTLSGLSYLWGVRGRYVALMCLINGALVTEIIGWARRSVQMLGATSVEELEATLKQIGLVGETHKDYDALVMLIKRFNPQNVIADYEYYWNERINDKIDAMCGISVVTATVSAATIFSFWFRDGYKRHVGWWFLAFLGHYNLYDNLKLYSKDTGEGDVVMALGHTEHAIGNLLGVWFAYWGKHDPFSKLFKLLGF